MKVHNFTGENAIKDAMDYAMRFAEKNNTPFNQELFDSLVSKGYITIDGKNPYEESMEDLEGGNMVDVEGGEVEGDNVEGSPDKVYHDYNAESTSGNSDDESLPETIRNVNRIREITSEYEKLYKQKRDILLNRVKVNGKYSDEDIAKLNDIDNKLGAIEDSDELATLLAPIADGDYVASDLKGTKYLIDDAMHGTFVNTLIGILNKAGTSKSKKSDLAGANWYDNIGLGSGTANFNKDMLGEDVYNHNKAAGKVNSLLEVAKKYADKQNENNLEADKKTDIPNESNENVTVQANSEGDTATDNSPKTISFKYGDDVYNMEGDKNAYLNKRDLTTAMAMQKHNKVSDEDIWEYLNQNDKFANAKEEDKQRTFERVKSKIEEISNKDKKKEDEVKTEETPTSTETETPVETEEEVYASTIPSKEEADMNEDTLNLSSPIPAKDKKEFNDFLLKSSPWLKNMNEETINDVEEETSNKGKTYSPNGTRVNYKTPTVKKEEIKGKDYDSGDDEIQTPENNEYLYLDETIKNLDYDKDRIKYLEDAGFKVNSNGFYEKDGMKTRVYKDGRYAKPGMNQNIPGFGPIKERINFDPSDEMDITLQEQGYKGGRNKNGHFVPVGSPEEVIPMNEDTLNGSGDIETTVAEKKPATKPETKKTNIKKADTSKTNTSKTGKKISMNDIKSWTKNILKSSK